MGLRPDIPEAHLQAYRALGVTGLPGECWPWPGPRSSGIPRFRVHGTDHSARRVALAAACPGPQAPRVRTRCRTRSCVNPDHLEPVKGPAGPGPRTHPRLTVDQVLWLRDQARQGRPAPDLARTLLIPVRTAQKAINGSRYRSVPDPTRVRRYRELTPEDRRDIRARRAREGARTLAGEYQVPMSWVRNA